VSSKLSAEELRAWQALLHAHHAVSRKLDAELRRNHDLALADYDILLRLANAAEGLSMTELAARVLATPSTLTRRVDGLVDAELVSRRRSERDSRVLLAALTDRGRTVLRRAALTHVRGIREHFTSRLTEPQLKNVAEALEVIIGGPHVAH
jgi:DNA-binding MarR family transcriptional regulator